MKLKLLLALVVFQAGWAQHRTCGTQEDLQQIMNDPEKKQEYIRLHNQFEFELQKTQTNKSVSNTVVIPVAVHFSTQGSASASVKTCLKNLAQTQIDILNADYNAANAEISNWTNDAVYYPMVTGLGNMNFQFVLATQNHPAGTGLTEGDVAVTFGTDFITGFYDTTWAGYLNFVVRPLPGGYLGYTAKLGCTPASGDCVVITPACFGSGSGCAGFVPTAPFNLGRTLTHELGHYFSLEHPFHDACNSTICATTGDYVCDTPSIASPSYDCPVAGSLAGCVSGEYALVMNFLDYADDACMYMLTKQQEDRARAWYNTIASQFKTNVLLANAQFSQTNFSIYPNPNKGSFTIEFKDFVDSYVVEVFDITGKVVYENNYSQNSGLTQVIDLGKVPGGIYFLNIKSDGGIVTKKLVLQ